MRIHSIEAIAIDIPLTEELRREHLLRPQALHRRHALRTEGGLVSEVYNGDNREHGARDRAPDPRGAGAARAGHEHLRRRADLGATVRPHHTNRDRKAAAGGHRLRRLRGVGPGRQGAGPERVRAARRLPRRGCPSSRSAATTWRARRSPTSAARWRPIAGPAWPAASSRSAGSRRRRTRSASRPRARRPGATSSWPSTPIAAGRPSDAIRFARLVEPLDIALVRGALPLVRRRRHDGRGAARHAHPRHRRTVARSPATACAGCSTRAPSTSSTSTPPSAAASPSGAAPPRCARPAGVQMAHHEESQIAQHLLAARAARHLRRVLRRSRARSRLADDVGEPAADQGRHDGCRRGPASAWCSTRP